MMKPVQFNTRIYKEGTNYLVEVSEQVAGNFANKGYIPVKGKLKGHKFIATLVPRKGSKYVMFLNQEIRKTTHTKAGNVVNITIEYDPESRELPVPVDLEDALNQNPDALKGFDKFSTLHRREIIARITVAKKPETREKRILKAVVHCMKRAKK